MQRFQIPVEVSDPDQPKMVEALLHELAGYLQALLDHEQAHTIDLHGLPIDESGKNHLRDKLGQGEVDITLKTMGESRIYETAYSGVWWVSHYDAEARLISEFIEVAWIPEIVKSQMMDVAQSAGQIKQLINSNE